jgi:hypothetical protein
MKFAAAAALAALLSAAPAMAQSLTPITGWVPLDSPKAKALLHDEPGALHRPAVPMDSHTDDPMPGGRSR